MSRVKVSWRGWRCSLVLAWAILLGSGLSGTALAAPPQLVVVVSVDQWAYEYFTRLEGRFEDDGLVQLVRREGAWFTNCHHPHALTYTAPGHAILLTGAYPEQNGIVDNSTFDRQLNTQVYCVADPGARLIGPEVDDLPVSPRRLMVETVGDRLKETSQGASKVFGVAVKDRASILMAGHRADAAYWMSEDGWWITSSAYRKDLPPYLRQLNEQRCLAPYAGQIWQRLKAPDRYVNGPQEDSFGERPQYDMSADFPHQMTKADNPYFVYQLCCSPFGNEVTLRAAMTILSEEGLGKDEHADLLLINLSSNDYVGHAFGPESLEAEDMTYRTDQMLGAWVRQVNELLPDVPWTIYVTADHGVCPIPERLQRAGQTAGRNQWGGTDARGSYELVRAFLERNIRQSMGLGQEVRPIIQAVCDGQVFFVAQHPTLSDEQLIAAQRACCEALKKLPEVEVAFAKADLMGDGPLDDLQQAYRRSLHPTRSGDVLFGLKRNFIYGTSGTTHGSPWEYDSHVPLMVWERAVGGDRSWQPGSYDQRVSPGSIAATIARQLNIDPPRGAQDGPLPLTAR
ncbi:MAG: alkaline phosphatase family protein [Pirellulales bacterium]